MATVRTSLSREGEAMGRSVNSPSDSHRRIVTVRPSPSSMHIGACNDTWMHSNTPGMLSICVLSRRVALLPPRVTLPPSISIHLAFQKGPLDFPTDHYQTISPSRKLRAASVSACSNSLRQGPASTMRPSTITATLWLRRRAWNRLWVTTRAPRSSGCSAM